MIATLAIGSAGAATQPSSTYGIVAEGGRAAGSASVTQAPAGVLIRVEATGLTPGWHGMHIHSVATCSDAGFKLSGGHVHAPSIKASVHGLLNAKATDLGDLPNIFAHTDGKASAEVFSRDLSLGKADGRLNLLDADGSALVIHASPDDHVGQPIGGAGARVACAAIK
jgi:Cu-Zn family superoxide dismutase